MLENLSALAIVPKAKAIAARRLSHGDYLELMRKRSVIEVTAALQSHPYFKDSLKGLSQTNLHRAQIEEALSKDVYYKYESLMRYSFRKGKFGAYFLMRSEINELLAKLRLLSMGFRHHYIIQVPGFLMPKTSFSLLRLAKAESAQDCLEVVAGTPYAKVLAGVLPAAGQKLDYLKCEHAFQSYFYTTVLAQIDRDLSGRSAADTKRLFRMEAEIYNLDLLFRAKAFFSPQLTPEDLKKLLIPVYGVLSAKNMNALADTRGLDEFLKLYNAGRADRYTAPARQTRRMPPKYPKRALCTAPRRSCCIFPARRRRCLPRCCAWPIWSAAISSTSSRVCATAFRRSRSVPS